MTVHKIGRDAIGAHGLKLKAKTVETVEFTSNLAKVEVVSDGAAAVYFTVDGGVPAVGGEGCFYLPAGAISTREVASKVNQPTVVQLISDGTPTCSVARVSE